MTPPRPVLSVLDLVPVSAGRSRAEALGEMVGLAQAADSLGYARYWLAEHHGSITYLSSATTVLMGQVLAATERIAVSSGGIMLPNHPPLVIAEQIGTLATMYPGRVGLGVGRAPGTDPLTAAALRRRHSDPRHFAEEVLETLAYLGAVPEDRPTAVPGSLQPDPAAGERGPGAVGGSAVTSAAASAPVGAAEPSADSGTVAPATSGRRVRAIPGEGTAPRVVVLGSSVNGARVAGSLGLPFVVASHFAPSQAGAAITSYRSTFDASAPTSPDGVPHVSAVVNVMVAPTVEEARYLFTTAMAAAARIVGGRPAPLDEPTEDLAAWRALAPGREAVVESSMALSFVGTASDVARGLRELAARWGLEEVLVLTYAHDAAARRRSYGLLARAW